MSARDHWPKLAAVYSEVGPPLRPCDEDLAIVRGSVPGAHNTRTGATGEAARLSDSHSARRPLRALVLGATLAGIGLPLLGPADAGNVDEICRIVERISLDLKRYLFLSGISSPAKARDLPRFIQDPLRTWLMEESKRLNIIIKRFDE